MKKCLFFLLFLCACTKIHYRVLMFDGDSMTAPTPADGGTEWPLFLKEQVGRQYVGWQNYALNGQTVAQMLVDQEEMLAKRSPEITILFVWAGINDLQFEGVTAKTLAERITQYHQNAGQVKTFAFTLTASQMLKYAERRSQIEAERLKFNEWLRQNWQAIGAEALVDLAADSRIGSIDAVTNPQYFQADRLHMNQGGRKVVAELARATLHDQSDF